MDAARPPPHGSLCNSRGEGGCRRAPSRGGHLAADVHGRVYDRALRLDDMKAALATIEAWVSASAEADAAKGLKPGNVVRLKA